MAGEPMTEPIDFLFHNNPEAMWIFDRDTLQFLAVNQAAILRYGYSEEEFLGMTIRDIRPPEDVSGLMKQSPHQVQWPQDAGRWRHRRKDGEIIIAEVRAYPLIYEGRAAEIVTARDVTAMDRFEKSQADGLRKEREAAALLSMAGRAARFGGWRANVLTDEIHWSEETAAIHESHNDVRALTAGLRYYVPEHRPVIEAAFQRCVGEGVPFDLVLRIVTGKGRCIWVRTIGEPDRDPEGRIIGAWGAFQDVDELMQARARSEATEKRLTETLNSISEGFMVLDQGWKITFANRAATAALMRADGELVGRNIWDEFPEARGSQFDRSYREAILTGKAVTFEEYFPPLETWFEVRAHPTPEGLAIHFRDVTERHRSLEALRASEERFRLVTNVTNDVIWDRDFATDECWWNEHMALQFGHEAEVSRLPGFWASHIHSEDRERVLTSLKAVLGGARNDWSDEYRFMRADGSQAQVVDQGLVIRDAEGAPVRMLGSMVDVTRRTETEAQLREAQKLEAVGQLTGGVAHDFNNLLTVIIGTAEALAERLGDDAESVLLAEMTSAAAQRGAELTSRLLAFARRQPLEPQATDIARLIMEFDPILRRTLSEEIDLEVVARGPLWRAMVDPGQLETAVLNLVINARDAMAQGGRLTIEACNVSLDETYARMHQEVTVGEYVLVSVSDSGCGMPPDIALRVFEPFFTTKEVGQGSGLGLSMVYGFAKQSHGHVKIYSEPGEGTTIRLYLPRAHAVQETVPADRGPARAMVGGHERVLVVEDDPMVRDHVARQLRGLGYAVTEVSDGQKALEHLKSDADYDLLFTDVVMPGGLNGRQLAQAARLLHPNLRVLFTSGYTENAIVHNGRLDPGVHLLSKPYRKRDLADKVRRVLDDPV